MSAREVGGSIGATLRVIDDSPLAVATLEDVILSKLEWAHRGG